jgi:NYN domain
MPASLPQRRVIAYVDGFNLYYGLKTSGWRRYLWLDLPTLVRSLLQVDQSLAVTKYFTSRIVGPSAKQKRQSVYLEALQLHCGSSLLMYYGHYQTDPWTCNSCGAVEEVPSEKKTDVNIAVEVMTDAFGDLFDTCVIISADSDLIPPILAVKRLFPKKRILVAFPPSRFSVELKGEAHASFTIGRAKFAGAQLPEVIMKPDGVKLRRPEKWSAAQTGFGSVLTAALDSPE